MELEKAKEIAFAAIGRLVTSAHPFTVSMGGRQAQVAVETPSPGRDENGRPVPTGLVATWDGGSTQMWLQTTSFRRAGTALTRWGIHITSSNNKDLLWIDLTGLLLRMTDELSPPATLRAYVDLFKLGTARDAARKRMTELVDANQLRMLGGRNVDAGQIDGSGQWRPSTEIVFERLVTVALLKVPFYELRGGDRRYEGSPPVEIGVRPSLNEASVDEDEEDEDAEVERDDGPPLAVRDLLGRIGEALDAKGQVILYGPPGTGKTWVARQFERQLLARRSGSGASGGPSRATMVTFHQAYSYEDFVEGLRPTMRDSRSAEPSTAPGEPRGEVPRYEVRDGTFLSVCRAAMAEPEVQHLLLVDEINRGNVSGILGELLTLLELSKRAKVREHADEPALFEGVGFVGAKVASRWCRGDETCVARLPYSQTEFAVPCNLWVIGTMNTADRSIALLDVALRRRFAFVEVPPDPTVLQAGPYGDRAAEVMRALNQRIRWVLDPDHCVGHSYLLAAASAKTEGDFEAAFHRAWAGDIVPLLVEYFHGDNARLRHVLGAGWFVTVKPPFAVMDDDLDGEDRFELEDPWALSPTETWTRTRRELGLTR